jgi:cytoskeletal protein CcmA (bactofilin family)
MFEKTPTSPPVNDLMRVGAGAGAPRRPAPTGAPTVLGPNLTFDGRITGDGELQIDGTVKGEIDAAKVVVGEKGSVEGTITGGEVEVRGRIIGNIHAQSVKLLESAHVEGDITHEQFAVEVGAYFDGRCQQVRPAPRRDEAAEAQRSRVSADAVQTPAV